MEEVGPVTCNVIRGGIFATLDKGHVTFFSTRSEEIPDPNKIKIRRNINQDALEHILQQVRIHLRHKVVEAKVRDGSQVGAVKSLEVLFDLRAHVNDRPTP